MGKHNVSLIKEIIISAADYNPMICNFFCHSCESINPLFSSGTAFAGMTGGWKKLNTANNLLRRFPKKNITPNT
jgi:hypothetical protein